MDELLALHIQDLCSGMKNTTRAEDRPLYEALLAYAAELLSLVVLKAPKEELHKSIYGFERLWGQSWLQSGWEPENPDCYELFKKMAGYHSAHDT